MKPCFNRRRFLQGLALSPFLPWLAEAKTDLRVAALDWALAETLIALGQKPVAIVAASDWARWVIEPPLPPGVADLGLQPEINFELLASLEPDLILTSPFVQQLEPVLEKIAETLRLSIYEKGTAPLARQRDVTMLLGERLNRAGAARSFLASAEQLLDLYHARIAVLDPLPLLLVSFMDARHVRVYGGSGLYQNVLDRIGLVNAWTRETNYWGYATVGIEELATVKDLRLIAFEPIPADTRPTLQQSPLWTRLPFVEAGHVSVLPPVLMFGAVPSALRFARLLVGHLEGLAA
jgi:ABC-type Fe3+-hydroxamate transport system substrate-binding protein